MNVMVTIFLGKVDAYLEVVRFAQKCLVERVRILYKCWLL